MPYHRHRRTECNTGPARPGRGCRASWLPTPRGPADKVRTVGSRSANQRHLSPPPFFSRGAPARVEYLIRPARVTDIERLVALTGAPVRASAAAGSMDSGDLLRQLVYLPQASIFI